MSQDNALSVDRIEYDGEAEVYALVATYLYEKPQDEHDRKDRHEAAYFALAMENSDRFPVRDAEMAEAIQDRDFEERFEAASIKRETGSWPTSDSDALKIERMDYFLNNVTGHGYQKTFSM